MHAMGYKRSILISTILIVLVVCIAAITFILSQGNAIIYIKRLCVVYPILILNMVISNVLIIICMRARVNEIKLRMNAN